MARWMVRVRVRVWDSGWPRGCSGLANSPFDWNVPAELKYSHLPPRFPSCTGEYGQIRTSQTEETSKMKLKIGSFLVGSSGFLVVHLLSEEIPSVFLICSVFLLKWQFKVAASKSQLILQPRMNTQKLSKISLLAANANSFPA